MTVRTLHSRSRLALRSDFFGPRDGTGTDLGCGRCKSCGFIGIAFAITMLFVSDGHSQAPSGDSMEYRAALATAVRAAAQRTLPSVVTIEIVGAAEGTVGDVRYDASTSGVLVDDEGYILASSIVVKQPSASLLVLLPDGTRATARVVARDRHRELILLKIDPMESLQPLSLPDRIAPQIGQTVIAVGRYGSEAAPMVSTGILSAVERLDGIALQTDARVSPSFYGGPLVDLSGNVLGILIPAVAEGGAEDETGWYDSGIAFAIPADVVARKLARLRQGEDIQRGLIGIVAKSNDPYEDDTTIAAVRTRSPAEQAGLQAGDRVLSVAGVPVRRHQQIKQLLGPHDAGDVIEIEVQREDESRTFEITLVESIPPLEPQRLGIVVAGELTVSAVLPGSPAEGVLLPGDVIEEVEEAEIMEARSLRRLLVTAEPNTPLSLRVRRGELTESVSIQPTGVAGPLVTDYPASWVAGDPDDWSIEPRTLPDAPNRVAVLRPKDGQLASELGADESTEMGLLVFLLNPGQGAPQDVLADWIEAAAESGVVVCAIAPEANGRWQAKEIEVISRMVASLAKQLPIDPAAVAVAANGSLATKKSEAADSMALAVGIAESRTFAGVAISDKTRPPGIRIRDNEPSAPLQLLLPISPDAELPAWGKALESRGYPIVRGGAVTPQTLLRWTRGLQTI